MNTYRIVEWPDARYFIHTETVTAESTEEALEIYSRIITEEGFFSLYRMPAELTEEDKESGEYIYVNGTMSGARYPIYLRKENLRIFEIGQS